MNRNDDPFIEFGEIRSALGPKIAMKIAIELAISIENTNNWVDDIGKQYENLRCFLRHGNDPLSKLYVYAYEVFDKYEYVRHFSMAGFDGAIHGGSGQTANDTEYKVFSAQQARTVYFNV